MAAINNLFFHRKHKYISLFSEPTLVVGCCLILYPLGLPLYKPHPIRVLVLERLPVQTTLLRLYLNAFGTLKIANLFPPMLMVFMRVQVNSRSFPFFDVSVQRPVFVRRFPLAGFFSAILFSHQLLE